MRPSARALWVVAALIAAALTGVWFIPHHTARDSVTEYIKRANATGTAFAKQYKDVSTAYRFFKVAPSAQAERAARLRLAAQHLTDLRVRLEQIPAPPEARTLRLRLVAFYRKQEQVAHEVLEITTYFPKLLTAEAPLRAAATQMRTSLAKVKKPKAQAAVLTVYAAAIGQTIDRIRATHAPALLAAAERAEAERLTKTKDAVRGVAAALRAHNRVALKKAVASLAVSNTAASAAARAAIVSYDKHIAEIRTLAARVEKERLRLERTL